MQFQKILSYDVYGVGAKPSYEHVCTLLAQEINPPSLESGKLNCRKCLVYCSALNRAFSCLDISTTGKVILLPALNEIPFSLAKYVTKKGFEISGSTAVRRAFIEAFVANDLNISHQELQRQLLEIIDLHKREPEALAVSHTFRLKLIQIYTQIGDELFNKPISIRDFIKQEVKILDFGETVII
jgi:hypothetical protein